MYILGLSCFYHDASACLLKDGKIIVAAEEERFSRRKHDVRFPINTVNWCLKDAGITIDDVDYVSFYEKPFVKFERMMSQHMQSFPKSYRIFVDTMPSWINEKTRIQSIIRKKLKYKKDIFYIEHHLAHAASSFFMSPFKESAIVTMDGVGEWDTTTLGYGKDSEIKLLKTIEFPHSIGLLYSTFTALLGFSVNNSEYKVMGLSPYGKPVYVDKFMEFIDIREDGSYHFDMSYFDFHYKEKMPGKKIIDLFGPVRKPDEKLTQHHKDIAMSLQKVTEDLIFGLLKHLHSMSNSDNVCMAGGVGLNSVANGKILKNTPFKNIYIQPASGDGGTSIGAAAFAYNSILKKERNFVLENCYLGPGYTADEVNKFLDESKIKYTRFKDDDELVAYTAKKLAEDNVIGWFQGRMEWGPRALGSRSILSNPCNPNMQDILNLKVKHREKFRPFAPVVCVEDAMDYFECDYPIPIPTDFMLMVYPIREEKRKLIPAVTHVDGSGRLQTIRREQNELYWRVIKEFGKFSGVPILINTSFNIRGEPIVCTPYDGYKCMMGTGIDMLVIDKFLVKREDNAQDMWDSEKLAVD